MKYRLSIILMLLFLLGYSQVGNEGKDEQFLQYVYANTPDKVNLKDLERNTKKYKAQIGNNPTQKQSVYLMFAEMIISHYHEVFRMEMYDNLIKKIGNSNDFPRIQSMCYRYIAFQLIGKNADYESIIKNYQKSIEIAKVANLDPTLGSTYNFWGDFFQDVHDYPNALKYKQLSVTHFNKASIKDMSQRIKLSRAEIFLKLYRNDKIKQNLDSASVIIDKVLKYNEISAVSDAYALKAYSELLLDNYQNSINYIDSSFAEPYYSKSTKQYIDDDFRNGIKTIAYFKKNDSKNGSYFLKKVNIKSPNAILAEIFYKELYVQSKRQGNYKDALDFYEKQNEIEQKNYFLNNQLQVRKFKEKLKVAEKDVQLAQLQTNKKSLTIGVIIIANLLIIGTVLSIIYFRRRGKQLKKVENDIKNFTENEIHKINYAKDEAVSGLRKQFSTQLHNDVGSILVATSSFLKSKKKLENNEEDKELWDDISEELQKVYNIVRNESHQIYDSSFDNAKFLTDLEKNIRLIFSGQSIDLHTNISIEKDKNLTPEIKLCILSTIREACTNILKYAKAKNVSIDLTNDDENIYLEISNDTKKRNLKSKQVSLGIGLINLNEQIKKLNGNFSANHTEDGFVISAEIPLK